MIFVTFQSFAYIAHVETEVLYDEIGHLTPYFTTNNQIRSRAVLQIQNQVGFFERLTHYDRFKYLLKELDPASFTVCN